MPTKRHVLETLSLKELQDIASLCDLEVGERRVRDQLVDAAGHSRKVVLADALLPRLLSGELRVSSAEKEVARHV